MEPDDYNPDEDDLMQKMGELMDNIQIVSGVPKIFFSNSPNDHSAFFDIAKEIDKTHITQVRSTAPVICSHNVDMSARGVSCMQCDTGHLVKRASLYL